MNQLNATLSEDHLTIIRTILEQEKGYDHAEIASIRLSPANIETGEIVYTIEHYDDFQNDLPVTQTYRSGHYMTYYVKSFGDLMEELRKLPSRESRELYILAQRIGVKNLTEQFKSEQARAFANDLLTQHASLLTMIENKEADS